MFPASIVEDGQRKKEVRNDNRVSQPSERNGLGTGEGVGCTGYVEERSSRWHFTGAEGR